MPRARHRSFCVILLGSSTLVATTAAAQEQSLPQVQVHGPQASAAAASLAPASPAFATLDVVDLENLPAASADRLEDVLKSAGVGSSSNNAGGLGPGINLRGFDVGGRLFVDGLPDIERFYSRDLATVATVEVLKGHSSVLYGQAAPGGTINYRLQQPSGASRSEVTLSTDNAGLHRLVLDHDQPFGDAALRLIYAGQSGATFIEQVGNRRQSLLLSGRLRYDGGMVRVELEYQRNERPYGFGTVHADGRFWYDRYYIAPASRALRQYRRQALYWEQALAPGWTLDAALGLAQVRRHETLAGFWTISGPGTLSSYYRKLDDEAGQNNLRIELRGEHTLAGLLTETALGYQCDRQRIDFSGPQNIGAYAIALAAPDFRRDWNALPLAARIARERYRESGLFGLTKVALSEGVHVMAGLRQSALKIDTASATTASTAADIDHLSSVAGASWQVVPQWTLHLSRSESFEPNRGTTRSGGFLQPRQGRQWETGLAAAGRHWRATLALFDLEQSRLTAPDPLDKNALVTIGTARVRGAEAALRWSVGALAWSANLGWQRPRNTDKVSHDLGERLVNVPARYGAMRLEWHAGARWRLWSAVAAVGQRPGDAENSFTAAGYAVVGAGIAYRIDDATSLSLEGGNLADRRYVEALSASDDVYQGERRRWSAGLRHRF